MSGDGAQALAGHGTPSLVRGQGQRWPESPGPGAPALSIWTPSCSRTVPSTTHLFSHDSRLSHQTDESQKTLQDTFVKTGGNSLNSEPGWVSMGTAALPLPWSWVPRSPAQVI